MFTFSDSLLICFKSAVNPSKTFFISLTALFVKFLIFLFIFCSYFFFVEIPHVFMHAGHLSHESIHISIIVILKSMYSGGSGDGGEVVYFHSLTLVLEIPFIPGLWVGLSQHSCPHSSWQPISALFLYVSYIYELPLVMLSSQQLKPQ